RRVGLQKIAAHSIYSAQPLPEGLLGLKAAEDWPPFMTETLPALRAKGWRCVMSDEFRFNVTPIDVIEGSVRESADGWFDLDMGITVGDRTVQLEPLLRDLFRRDPRWLSGRLEQIGDEESVDLKTDRGAGVDRSIRRRHPEPGPLADQPMGCRPARCA